MAFKHKQQPKKKPIHVWIGTPAYDGKVQTDFAMALAETCQLATAFGIRVTVCILRNMAFIDMARNHLARLFLETDATHLFFIDSDLEFEPRALLSLAMAERPICAGVYPKRQDPEEFPVRFAYNEDETLKVDDKGWVLCEGVPTGFLCIERRVIEEMSKDARVIKSHIDPPTPQLFHMFVNENDMYVGEDYAFCRDYVNKYHEYIPVWPDFDFTHGERWKGNLHQYLLKQTAVQDQDQTSSAA
jgi:hypothetical protein